jgi:low affinity Fe/Cu permease
VAAIRPVAASFSDCNILSIRLRSEISRAIFTGPLFHYSDTWQLVINTGTTIITFMMVFIIQNTQNRDARAINLKLDELIHAIDTAKNQMMNIEKLSDEELDVIHEKYTQMRADCVDDEGRSQSLTMFPVDLAS